MKSFILRVLIINPSEEASSNISYIVDRYRPTPGDVGFWILLLKTKWSVLKSVVRSVSLFKTPCA
jgi:hypothetical protein